MERAMASAYFLNAQPGQISITLNSGATQQLAGLNDQDNDPSCKFDIGPSPTKDVMGLKGDNTLVVRTNNVDSQWTIKFDRGVISINTDIQFLVFGNKVVGRQGIQTKGFIITQTAASQTVKAAGSKRRKRVPSRG
jgi:hypothetical protein